MPNSSYLIRVISLALTAIVTISFVLFVWDEAGTASKNQALLATPQGKQIEIRRDEHGRLITGETSRVRAWIDRTNDALTSPGESLGKKVGDNNPWALRAFAFIFGLLIFLLGLRVLASWLGMQGPKYEAPERQKDDFTAGYR